MLAIKLAYRNLVGAGLRTWLNVFVLSLSYVVIIWHKGFLDGWNRQAQRDMIAWEIGGGQYWHSRYDPYDPFTIEDSHGPLPTEFQSGIRGKYLTPILIAQATMYPEGRIQSVRLKGIDPEQQILQIPTGDLLVERDAIPAVIGTRMARNSKLQVGDFVTIRWRDDRGVFDAAEVEIVRIFKTNVPTVDVGQLWIPLQRLQSMMQLPGEATIVVRALDAPPVESVTGWNFQGHDVLLAELRQIIKSKTVGGLILYVILMSLAMLAIFDTQVLSIFRRQKEIGTHIALGMTRGQVVRLFTAEGAGHGILAALLAALYGIPFLSFQAVRGYALPLEADDYGLAIAERIFPVYSLGLVAGTTLIVLITTTIVSFIPARRITRMKPTDALRGKIQ
jgi:ABC-type lipoprotein release transport system permease subunit